MSKYLIVAHPDDEVLWFNPENYDKIIIVFTDREDRYSCGDNRREALAKHPLKDKIINWNLTESGYWRDKTKIKEYNENMREVLSKLVLLELNNYDEVDTHNANGEYGHSDHILIHNCCMAVLNCRVNGKNPALYRKIKDIYVEHDCWTWQ